jgi:hypothetical protein
MLIAGGKVIFFEAYGKCDIAQQWSKVNATFKWKKAYCRRC